MKFLTLLLYLISLGVCVANPQWVAVLHRNHSAPSAFGPNAAFVLNSVEGAHRDTFELGSFRGYSFSGSEDAAERIAQLPEVAYVQPNRILSLYDWSIGPPPKPIAKQKTSSWNLREISHRTRKGRSKIPKEYLYDERAGEGTVVYVVDTGIDIKHKEFEGRATWGMSSIDGKVGLDATDRYGHGTHVAGIVGGRKYGVAKKTKLVAVKVINDKGTSSTEDVIKGLFWAYLDAKQRGFLGRAIANLSLGGPLPPNTTRDAVMDAVAEAVERGMFVVTAAGNGNALATLQSPGAEPAGCNVGAYDKKGRRAGFSNFGPGVDIWAPGVQIDSVWKGRVVAMSGTSQAAPHVAGVAALRIGGHGAQGLCEQMAYWSHLKGKLKPDGGAVLYNGGEGYPLVDDVMNPVPFPPS